MSSAKDSQRGGTTGRAAKSVARTARTGRAVSAAPSTASARRTNPASTVGKTVVSAAKLGRFAAGTTVNVPLGARRHDATVIDSYNGRVRVAIHVAGADEALVSSYRPDQIA